jgi:hypothetical protein
MLASELVKGLEKFPNISKYLRDVCSIDTIPEKLSAHQFIIVNTEYDLVCLYYFIINSKIEQK